jgi:hypothetical protein
MSENERLLCNVKEQRKRKLVHASGTLGESGAFKKAEVWLDELQIRPGA